MRRYTLEVNGKTFSLDVDELAADRFIVLVGEETYEVRLSGDEDLPGTDIGPGIALDVRQRAAGSRQPSAGSSPAPGQPRPAPLAPRPSEAGSFPPAPAPAGRGGAGGARGAVLSAPMPGVVLDLLVAPGAPVTRGQPALVLEAMKMRNTICAPRDGVVAEVFVQAGQTVGHADPLIRFEAVAS